MERVHRVAYMSRNRLTELPSTSDSGDAMSSKIIYKHRPPGVGITFCKQIPRHGYAALKNIIRLRFFVTGSLFTFTVV